MNFKIEADITRPWEDSEICLLGLYAIRNEGRSFEVGLGLFFITFSFTIGGETDAREGKRQDPSFKR